MKRRSILPIFCLLTCAFALPRAQSVELIRDGRPQSQIVVAEEALPQVRFAAKELQEHLRAMSGATLPIVSKPDGSTPHLIYVGESEATRALGVELGGLPMEGYRVVATEKALVLAGRDGTTLPIPRDYRSRSDLPRLTLEWQKKTGTKWDIPRSGLYNPRFFNEELGFSIFDPTGTLFAVYDFLESLGVRWYLPYYDFGTVIPSAATVNAPEQDRSAKPVFGLRFMRWSFPESDKEGFLWAKRQKLGMEQMIWLAHGTSNVTRMLAGSHPEYFATVGGRLLDGHEAPGDGNRPEKGGSLPRLAPPLAEALSQYADAFFAEYPEMTTFPVGPSDGFTSMDDRDVAAGWLREERGRSGRMSDYVWKFVNDAAERIGLNHPGKVALGLAYSYYRLVPGEIEKLHDNVGIIYCQHRGRELMFPERREAFFRDREAWWKKLPSGEFYIWEYYRFQLGKKNRVKGERQEGQLRGVPAFFPTILQEDMKALRGRSKGEFVECSHAPGRMLNPGLNHLNYAIQARLYWDPDLDLEAYIGEYCCTFFGPAAEEMRAFYRFAEEVWMRPVSRQITLTGGFVRPADVEHYFALLEKARARAGESVYAKRIDVIREECEPMKEIFPALQRQGPDFTAPRAAGHPQVDGDLSKPFWSASQGAPVYPMRDLYSEEEATPATTVQFRWADDDSGLYVGITAMEPEMERLRTAITADIRDSESIYDTEVVELFMETPERSTFVVAVNPEGAIYDKCTDSRVVENPVSWSADWKVATRKGGDRWSVELFIPRESLAGAEPPTAKAPWGLNVCRTRFLSGKAQNSAISPTQGGFFQTVKFGNLIAPPRP